MPNVKNNIISKIWQAFKDFFGIHSFDYGSLTVKPSNHETTIHVDIYMPVSSVYLDMEIKQSGCSQASHCWLSEVLITDKGFQFTVKNDREVVIKWFAFV